MPRQRHPVLHDAAFTYDQQTTSEQERINSFRQRQQNDLKRVQNDSSHVIRQRRFRETYRPAGNEDNSGGEESWRDSEGDRLDDFGVDEDVEFYDEDSIPLAQLLQKRRLRSENAAST